MNLIKKSNELVIPTNIKMMVYGQAGMGKSTYALSAPKPLLFDFDGGVKRINAEHLKNVDTVQVSRWEEISQVLREDLSAYETIVVDTIGKMMDFIISYKCPGRVPQIKDWNGINQEFSNFVRNLSNLNKHIVFVAHRDTRKEGDETVFIPSLREKSYNSIVTELDLLGYIEARNINGVIQRTVTFDPTVRNDGKNTCNLPAVMEIKTIIDPQGRVISDNTAIQRQVIAPYLSMLQKKREESEKYNKVVEEIQEAVKLITDAVSANDFVGRIDKFEHVGSSLQMARQMFKNKVESLRLIYNPTSKLYEPAA